MRAARSALFLALALIAFAGGCSPGLPVATPAQIETARQRWPDARGEQLSQGRQLYVYRCSSCHNLYLPTSHDEDEWRAALDEMAGRAHLTPAESEAILRYLVSARDSAR